MELIKNDKGSATIETSVMFLLIIMLTVGFIHLTHAVTLYAVAQTAAREGAREYAMTDSKAKAINKAKTELQASGVDLWRAKIHTKADGQERVVTVDIDYGFHVPLIGRKDITMQGGAAFRKALHGR